MPVTTTKPGCRGLVLAEALAAVATVALLAAVLVVGAAESRRVSSLGDSVGNLKTIAAGTGHYAADNADRTWAYTWRAGIQYVPTIPAASSDQAAAAYQAADIIRRRADPAFPLTSTWVPQIIYTHLVLADYLDERPNARLWASPEDRSLLQWQTQVYPPGSPDRFRFSSSYELQHAFWGRDARQLSPPVAASLVQSPTSHQVFVSPPVTTVERRVDQVRFPAQKAHLYDRVQRHLGPRHAYFMYPEARVLVLAADGAVALRATGDAGEGFRPDDPLSPLPPTTMYTPSTWEPPTLSGAAADPVTTYYRFTRSGLRGRDFGGPEVPWQD